MASGRGPFRLPGVSQSNPETKLPHSQIPVATSDLYDPPLSLSQQRQPHENLGKPVVTLMSNNPFFRAPPQAYYQDDVPRSPISPSSSSKFAGEAKRQTASLERQQSLRSYFSIEEVPRTSYTDQEFADIARLLEGTDRVSWSRVPRIYTVLRLIGQVTAIDSFLDLGLNDMWLPFNVSQLPHTMSAFHRSKFVESQNMVL